MNGLVKFPIEVTIFFDLEGDAEMKRSIWLIVMVLVEMFRMVRLSGGAIMMLSLGSGLGLRQQQRRSILTMM